MSQISSVLVMMLFLAHVCVAGTVRDRDYYDDDYYDEYEDEDYQEEYDLEELVKAWRNYIKEKATLGGGGGGGGDRGHHRGGGGGRRRPRPPVQDYVEYECEPRSQSYRVPDETQCDKFRECNIKGEIAEMLCPDGLVFDIKSEHCDYPAKVNCTGRPDLQPAQSTKNCPRANGFFPWPAEKSCQKFYDCRGGMGYLQTCPEGVIFDPKIDACVTPDQSVRKECSGGKFLGFDCPKYKPDDVLRFGNHDRLSNPKNCVQFFSCLRHGSPRLGVCPKKTVFNNSTGHCDDPALVPGCEDYWSAKEAEEYDSADYYNY